MKKEPALRVGKIPYANLYPIYRALEKRFPAENVRFVPGHPADLNRRLRAGRLDISPSSSIEYARRPERYLLCPDIAIAARAKVMSVVLLSRAPVKSLSDEPIAVTGASDTSVVLLEILLREFAGRRNRLVRTGLGPRDALRRHPAFLAIGDQAIRASLSGAAPRVTDLGAWWRRETGTPFVFALWIATRAAARDRGEGLRRFGRSLLLAKAAARAAMDGRLGGILDGPAWIPRDFLEEYWRNLSYDLGPAEEGLRLFFRLAAKIGRIPAAPPLRFLDLHRAC
ncbi:MAG: menaquinone biosynthetic enzyme MqnA/MqnD family protein [Gemmatimonadota bacterium]